ncbi:60S ribosomal protein L26-like [Grammomys surdaster]|uniref:60S ribosomal protein L26-like n=1 Tax=Grammomys surdaster TaxID=491861 RepID=UPI0010A03072|nr:60S ribosomal protein L26-like [Grammomys surdaster]
MSLGGQEDGDRHAFAAEARREVRTGSASEEEWSLGLKLEAKSELRTFNSLLLCDSRNTGQMVQGCRKAYIIYVDRVQQEKANGTTVHVGIHPSKVGIPRLKLDKGHKKILERKAKSQQVGKEKGRKDGEDAGVETS